MQITLIIIEKVIVSAKYSNFANLFSKKSAEMLLERTSINKHAIKLIDSKQSLNSPIYSLDSIELKTIKNYIEIN